MRKPTITLLSLLASLGLYTGDVSAADLPFYSTYPKIDMSRWYISNGWTNGGITACEWRATSVVPLPNRNLALILNDKGGSVRKYGCAEIHTNALSGYGSYEATIRTAAGSGLNT